MNLSPEQLAYLKSLESPKKRRKFMLDCLVENVLGESVKFEEEINRLNVSYQTSTSPEAFKGLLQFCGASEDESDKNKPLIITHYDCKREGRKFFKQNHCFKTNDTVWITDLNGVKKTGIVQEPENENEFKVILSETSWEPLLSENLTVSISPFKSAKSNYSPEEIEIVKSLNSERRTEKKWTDEDMKVAFLSGGNPRWQYIDFDVFFDNFKKDKNE